MKHLREKAAAFKAKGIDVCECRARSASSHGADVRSPDPSLPPFSPPAIHVAHGDARYSLVKLAEHHKADLCVRARSRSPSRALVCDPPLTFSLLRPAGSSSAAASSAGAAVPFLLFRLSDTTPMLTALPVLFPFAHRPQIPEAHLARERLVVRAHAQRVLVRHRQGVSARRRLARQPFPSDAGPPSAALEQR